MKPKLLIIGKTGQLARELADQRTLRRFDAVFLGRDAVDLQEPEIGASRVLSERPALVILAAAYTDVDRAEIEPEVARTINVASTAAIARATETLGSAMLFISSDYVFDGGKQAPYVESDPVNPGTVYGCTKAEGERAVAQLVERHSILRTSWLFSPHRRNFVKTMCRLAAEKDEVSVVDDQIGNPTAAAKLAVACLEVGERLLDGDGPVAGMIHFAGEGEASWADLAQTVFDALASRGRRAPKLNRITSAEYRGEGHVLARRPADTRLETRRARALGLDTGDWRVEVGRTVDQILAPGCRM